MDLVVKISVTFLLLVHVFYPVLLQETATDTPAPRPKGTIPATWLRELPKQKVNPNDIDPNMDENAMESGNEDSSGGISSGFIIFSAEDSVNETMEYTTQAPTFPNETTTMVQPEIPDGNLTTTQLPKNDVNMTDFDTENENFTINTMPQNSTKDFNYTDILTTTVAPEKNESTLDSGLGFTNETENNGTSTTAAAIPEEKETTTTAEPMTTPGSTTTTPTKRTTTLLETTTSAPVFPDRANISNKEAASGGAADRGLASDSHKQRKSAWGAVLGTFVAVAFVGLVAYVILKKKHHKAFSHRKLVEEFPSDPVLRLDNSEPLDLNFGRAAYYNPSLQGGNIPMNNFNKK